VLGAKPSVGAVVVVPAGRVDGTLLFHTGGGDVYAGGAEYADGDAVVPGTAAPGAIGICVVETVATTSEGCG